MLGRYLIIIISLGLNLLLSACGNHTYHVVKSGETLYSIGWAYGYDYKRIAAWNGIDEPYSINNGQIIKLVPPKGKAAGNRRQHSRSNVDDVNQTRDNARKGLHYAPSRRSLTNDNSKDESSDKSNNKSIYKNNNNKINITDNRKIKNRAKKIAWKWPTISKNIVQYFSATDIGKKGVKIAGRNGQSIKAAASGRVVYSGSGLIGYGRLIIIKHDGVYLSAYAHNRELLVKEGDEIKLGQKIATMGSSGTNRVMLHFEIRRDGVPVNPLDFLPRRG